MEDVELEEILKQVKIVEDMKVDPNDIGYFDPDGSWQTEKGCEFKWPFTEIIRELIAEIRRIKEK